MRDPYRDSDFVTRRVARVVDETLSLLGSWREWGIDMKYDPDRQVDVDEWRATDEGEKTILVEEHHERAGVELPNPHMHAVAHVIVENQIAMGDELSVRRTLDRLTEEGLGRHDAIHAIGSIVAAHMFDMLKRRQMFDDEAYRADLERLTAESWRKGGSQEFS